MELKFYPGIDMKYSTEHNDTTTSDTLPQQNITAMGKVGSSSWMRMMISSEVTILVICVWMIATIYTFRGSSEGW